MKTRAIIAFFSLLTALALFFVGAAALVLVKPELVINPSTMTYASKRLAIFGVDAKWEAASASFESHGLLDKTANFSFDELCVEAPPALDRACFSRAEVSFRFALESFVPKLKAMGPARLEGGDVALRIGDDGETNRANEGMSFPEISLPKWLRDTDFFDASVSIKKLEMTAGETRLTGSIDASVKTGEGRRILSADAQGLLSEESSGTRLDFKAAAESNSGFISGDWSMTAHADAKLKALGNSSLDVDISSADGKTVEGRVEADYSLNELRARLSLDGTLSNESFAALVAGEMRGFSETITAASTSNCKIALAQTDAAKNRGRMKLDCPVKISLKKFSLPGEFDPFYELPQSLALAVSATADAFFLPDLDQRIDGRVTARIEPVKGRLVKTQGSVGASFSGILSKPADNWKFSTDADLHFIIDEFSKLERRLADTRWPVPAPFNALDGAIDFSLQGGISTATSTARFPAKLSTRLSSKDQKLFTDSTGELTFRLGKKGVEDASLDLNVDLTDVQLQLPNLALATLPQLNADSRIALAPAPPADKSKKGSSLAWKLKIANSSRNPVRVLSNITPTFVPLSLDLVVDEGGAVGNVSINNFPVELFRRKGRVDKLELDLKKPSGDSLVNGSFSIPSTDYTISVLFAGTVDNPNITLVSEPPLSEGDIISTLIYGEPMDSLDADDASSVGSLSAAIADRALALTSMFVLASTPIQSIGYNPQTKAFSARIKLGKSTTLVAGSGGGTQQVGIRQRLGKGWKITTSYGTTTDPSAISGATALIEWTKRY